MNKNTNIFERIELIVEREGFNSVNDFAINGLGWSASEKLNRLKDPSKRPSVDILIDISNKFGYSVDWLLFGNDQEGNIDKPNIQKLSSNEMRTKKRTFLDKTKDSKNVPILKNDDSEVKPNIKNKLYNESITKSITFSDKTKNAENVTHLIEDPLGIPLIPIAAMAGFGEGDFQIMEYETSRYLVPEFTELKVDFMIKVKGSSMRPKYNSGDLVACKKLDLTGVFFQWNKVYVLATEQGALIKRVKKGTDDDHILIVSDNPAYDPFELSISKINAIAIVCGVIRLE